MKKIIKVEFVIGLLLGVIILYPVKKISYQQGYLQSIRDRNKALQKEIDILDKEIDSALVSSFPDHSEIPTNNLNL